MAALTMVSLAPNLAYGIFESIAIVDQAAASTAVSKGFVVPNWANALTIVLDLTVATGTAPSMAFNVRGVNIAKTQPPDTADFYLVGSAWVGITAKTAASKSTMHFSPLGAATDNTGSATADDSYSINCNLPRVMVYTYTTVGGGGSPEDYTATISGYFHKF